jgi:hypothetical protein
VELTVSGATNESLLGAPQVVLPTGATAQAVTVTATAVNASGLGRYTVNVNRSAFSWHRQLLPQLRFVLNSGRTLTVQLSINKPAANGTSTRANFGPVYVLLVDPATGNVDSTVRATCPTGATAGARPATPRTASPSWPVATWTTTT